MPKFKQYGDTDKVVKNKRGTKAEKTFIQKFDEIRREKLKIPHTKTQPKYFKVPKEKKQ